MPHTTRGFAAATVATLLALVPSLCARSASAGSHEGPVEARSLLGAELQRPDLPTAFRAEQERLLAEARAALARDPASLDAVIWVGRRTAYLGRYREAIGIYTEALARHPDEPRLLRHRGHRWITVRELDRALHDLSRAAALVRGQADRVEADGLPNERGTPTSTLQSNIWYHLGLSHYLRGELDDALAAYRQCLEVSKNPDMLTATTYWLYLTLRRLGRHQEAGASLVPITAELDIIENHDYHRLLLAYKGGGEPDQLWAEAGADPEAVRYSTVAYGIGAWHLVEGRGREARTWLERALESSAWSAFGFIAAEAELARRQPELP